MAVTLTGTGGWGTRFGRLAKMIDSCNDFLGTGDLTSGGLRSVGVGVDNIDAQFASALQYVVTNLYSDRDAVRSALDGFKGAMRDLAEQMTIEQVHADNPLPEKNIEEALKELFRQMRSSSDDFDASTVSSTTADVSVTGDAALFASVLRSDGYTNELVLAEVIDAICTSAKSQGATDGQAEWTFRGENPVSNALAWDWPDGSGSEQTLTEVDATLDCDGGNMLVNSDMESFTSDIPDSWTRITGTATTHISREASTIYSGTYSLEFTGDGSTNMQIAQKFAQSSTTAGSTETLEPNTVYHVVAWIRKGASISAGVLRFALANATTHTVLTMDNGSACSTSLAHGAMTTSFAPYLFTLVTPKTLPLNSDGTVNVELLLDTTTAISNTHAVFIDHISMTPATQMYVGGPYISAHSGATDTVLGDRRTLTIANNYESEFVYWLDRMFDLKTLDLMPPTDTGGTETVADSLIA